MNSCSSLEIAKEEILWFQSLIANNQRFKMGDMLIYNYIL